MGALLALQGCASIVSGSTQVVSVDTPGCPGARCELSNDKGKYFVTSTPGTVTLGRSYNNLQVTCTREGASSDPVSVASTTKGMAFGNILIGGVIGAGVDVSTGAAYDYPQFITVPMQCGPGAAPAVAAAPAAPAPVRLGLQVERLTAADGAAAPPGVRILQVAPQSPAELAGLKAGDVILQVNGVALRDPDDLAARVAAASAATDAARELQLLLRRGAEDLTLRLALPPAAAR
ncbi:MAG: PDZ domain-containing protein [Aquabacterium sp.]|nr:PDZ domain-containing protein [Aquabacterium sp.]